MSRSLVLKWGLSVVVGLLGSGTLAAAEPTRKTLAQTFHVMSWNIRYDNPRDGVNAWKHREGWVAKIVAERKVDIAGLQEVLAGQLRNLKKRLPHMAAYGVGRDDGKTRGEFAPILYRKSRFTLLDSSTFWLSRTPNKAGSRDWDAAITRIASWVKLKDRNSGKTFFIVNTHFDHRGRVARAKSAGLIVKQLRNRFRGRPVILTGDFNTTPGTPPYETLVRSTSDAPAFQDALRLSVHPPEGPNSTWCGFRAVAPNRRIDFQFVTPGVRVETHQILVDQRDGRFPSDHLPVLTRVSITK